LLPIELFGRARSGDVRGVEPNQITRFELNGFMLFVVIACLIILCLFDIFNKTIVDSWRALL